MEPYKYWKKNSLELLLRENLKFTLCFTNGINNDNLPERIKNISYKLRNIHQIIQGSYFRYPEIERNRLSYAPPSYYLIPKMLLIHKQLKQVFKIKKHELKWRYVNAEITCRPITGLVYQEFITLI